MVLPKDHQSCRDKLESYMVEMKKRDNKMAQDLFDTCGPCIVDDEDCDATVDGMSCDYASYHLNKAMHLALTVDKTLDGGKAFQVVSKCDTSCDDNDSCDVIPPSMNLTCDEINAAILQNTMMYDYCSRYLDQHDACMKETKSYIAELGTMPDDKEFAQDMLDTCGPCIVNNYPPWMCDDITVDKVSGVSCDHETKLLNMSMALALVVDKTLDGGKALQVVSTCEPCRLNVESGLESPLCDITPSHTDMTCFDVVQRIQQELSGKHLPDNDKQIAETQNMLLDEGEEPSFTNQNHNEQQQVRPTGKETQSSSGFLW